MISNHEIVKIIQEIIKVRVEEWSPKIGEVGRAILIEGITNAILNDPRFDVVLSPSEEREHFNNMIQRLSNLTEGLPKIDLPDVKLSEEFLRNLGDYYDCE